MDARALSYQSFRQRIEQICESLQREFGSSTYRPVILLPRRHEHDALVELYRAADVCAVTSLHDGMNLVCKEFVAARDDNAGVLVLSRFAGAAREMSQALIVNPYHVEECADALHQALMTPVAEQARAHGQPAQHAARVQRLPLGRPHAVRAHAGS